MPGQVAQLLGGDRAPLVALASSPVAVRSVRFVDGQQTIATVRRGAAGVFTTTWRNGTAAQGRHVLRAIVTDAKGRQARAERAIRICR